MARDLGLISRRECSDRIRQTLVTLSHPGVPRSRAACSTTGTTRRPRSKLTIWPVDGSRVYPFLSSVDNGWLAAALIVVKNADPSQPQPGRRDSSPDELQDVLQPEAAGIAEAGLIKGGFWDAEPAGPAEAHPHTVGNYLGVGPTSTTPSIHYDTTVSETRIASYIAIARGQVPRQAPTSAPGVPSLRL